MENWFWPVMALRGVWQPGTRARGCMLGGESIELPIAQCCIYSMMGCIYSVMGCIYGVMSQGPGAVQECPSPHLPMPLSKQKAMVAHVLWARPVEWVLGYLDIKILDLDKRNNFFPERAVRLWNNCLGQCWSH